MRFDWSDLRIFLHVCEAGSMTAAAERAHLTLAAVSARMRSLEEGNGIVLLNRHARGVSPTPAGEVLARHARLVFEQVQRLESDLLGEASPGRRRLVLLANSSALARPLAAACAELCGAGEQVVVRESPSEASVQAIRSGAADVGIVSDAVDTEGLVTQALGADPLVVVMPQAHALAGRATLRFSEALGEPWVSWGEQSALSTHLAMRAIALGARVEARVAYPRLAGVLQLVARGTGLTVLPRSVIVPHGLPPGIACVPLQEAWARRQLVVCYREAGDPLRVRLADTIRRDWPPG